MGPKTAGGPSLHWVEGALDLECLDIVWWGKTLGVAPKKEEWETFAGDLQLLKGNKQEQEEKGRKKDND